MTGPVLPPSLPPELSPRGSARPRSGPGRVRLSARGRRVLFWVAGVTSGAVLLTAGGLWVVYHAVFGNIVHINAFDPLAKNGIHRPAPDAKAENFLLVGSDTRAGANGIYQAAAGSADYTTGQRSDTVMLVHVPTGPAKASIISFPRDSWVTIPRWNDSKGVTHPEHQEKLNAAFAEGGAPLLIATLERLSGIRVDHVVQVDFTGFKNMVNALGGITLCVKTSRHEAFSGDYLTAGPAIHVNGDQALAFVRDRKTFPDQDLSRIKDQQYFLSVVLHKVLSAGTLTNPVKLYGFATAAAKSLTTDKGFGLSQMKTLATRLHSIDPAHVAFLQVPILTSNGREGGQSVVELDTPKLAAVFNAMKDNGTPAPGPGTRVTAGPRAAVPPAGHTSSTPKTTPVAQPTRAPSSITVTVANGTGRAHLAATTAAILAAAGFHATTGGNATRTATTVVYYGAGQAAAARAVADAVPGAVVQEKASAGGVVELVLGTGFAGLTAHHGGAPAVPPVAKPSATVHTTTVPPSVALAPTAASVSCAP